MEEMWDVKLWKLREPNRKGKETPELAAECVSTSVCSQKIEAGAKGKKEEQKGANAGGLSNLFA